MKTRKFEKMHIIWLLIKAQRKANLKQIFKSIISENAPEIKEDLVYIWMPTLCTWWKWSRIVNLKTYSGKIIGF